MDMQKALAPVTVLKLYGPFFCCALFPWSYARAFGSLRELFVLEDRFEG